MAFLRTGALAACAFLSVAAGPAEDAERLMESGQERQAFELVERAAAAGDADAIDYLGWFYDRGRVVDQDLVRAARYYRQAAELGQSHAQWRRGGMLDLRQGT